MLIKAESLLDLTDFMPIILVDHRSKMSPWLRNISIELCKSSQKACSKDSRTIYSSTFCKELIVDSVL